MKRFYRYILIAASFLAGYSASSAAMTYHCENDSVEVRMMLGELRDNKALTTLGDRIEAAALMLVDKGADDYYATDSIASLRVNVDSFTPMTFINTCIALAQTASTPAGNEMEFERRLGAISCRGGNDAGFPSIMWHSSDWIVDNIYRGNVRELTENYEGARSKSKSLDYYTRHADEFAVMQNPEIAEKVQMTEMGFRTHRVPVLPKQAVERKDILSDMRNGDIMVMICNNDGEDIYNIGVISKDDSGLAHLIHYDPAKGKVVREDEPMKRYFNLTTKYFNGFRLIRVNDD